MEIKAAERGTTSENANSPPLLPGSDNIERSAFAMPLVQRNIKGNE